MKKRLYFINLLCLILCCCLMLGLLGACSKGETPQPVPSDNETYISPTINEDGKLEYTHEGANVVIEDVEPLDAPTVPSDIFDTNMEEVYLNPNQIEPSKFEYLDDSGDVAAVWEVLPVVKDDDFTLRPGVVDVWGLDWELVPGRVFTEETSFEPLEGIVTIYFSVYLTSTEDSYLGYFDSTAQRYTWLEPPNDEDYYLKLTVNSTNAINVAFKHNSQEMIKYTGQYRLSPPVLK